MKAYFVEPILTIGNNVVAQKFYEICYKELNEHVEVVSIPTEDRMLSTEVGTGDFILFFNRTDELYKDYFCQFLEEACENNAELIPIATNDKCRTPSNIAGKSQSFDIVENLRKRGLSNSNIATIALSLARTVVSKMQPTLTIDRMHIFLSHRRQDGEEFAADFCKRMRIRAEDTVFRDLIDIRVGEEAQEIIESNLKKSDVVIFLDTPLAGESDWIAKELTIALGMNIPIIWVRIGEKEGRKALKVKPADKPHFEFDKFNLVNNEDVSILIDAIIHKAFSIYRENAKKVFDNIHVIKNIAKAKGMDFKKVDTKNMIYKLEIPRKGFSYYQKPMIHIVQCFNRHPKEQETKNLGLLLDKLGYGYHPSYGPYYDASILLAPTKEEVKYSEEPCVIDSFDKYIHNIEEYQLNNSSTRLQKKGIIISGAFPDCEPEFQQQLHDAVYAFVQEIFRRKAVIIFGSHPTFQRMIFYIGASQNTYEYQRSIHMYVSEYFVTKGAINEFRKKATVFPTENVNDERNSSLSLMRKIMIDDEEAIALICLGGKRKTDEYNPGVDEEIELAKQKGLQVFIIGSTGGRASELALEYSRTGWGQKLNGLSAEQNKNLMVSLDYTAMAKEILDSLGI